MREAPRGRPSARCAETKPPRAQADRFHHGNRFVQRGMLKAVSGDADAHTVNRGIDLAP